MDYENLMQKHEKYDADLTVATIPVTAEDAPSLGIMKTGDSGRIVDFIEKPTPGNLEKWKSETGSAFSKDGRNYLASMGINIFKKEILSKLLDQFSDATDFGKEVIPNAISHDYKVQCYEFDGYWTDIGTIKSFFEANLSLTDDLPKFNLYDNEESVYTRARLLPASKLSGTTFDHSIVTEGCLIEASHIERSVIGIRSRIGKDTTIKESIIMGNDFFQSVEEMESGSAENPAMGIGKGCTISRAIIDKNCKIGDNVQIAGGDHLEDGDYGNYNVVDGIVIVAKNTVIKERTKI
jgi:glucose-1-phosphate adenylyltransferase